MKLYYIPGACSLASHIVALEAALDIQLVQVHFNDDGTRTTDDGENFYDVNPLGYVPALRLDNGEVLTEGAAILQYLADQSLASLVPEEKTMERYRMLEKLTFVSTEIHKTFSTLYRPDLPETEKEFVVSKLQSRFAYLDTWLQSSSFIAGDTFSIVDAYAFTVLNWRSNFDISVDDYPQLTKYLARVAERPAVQKAMRVEGLIS